MSDNKKQNKPNVPNLRFPEFSGEWHEVALNELAPNISSGNSKQSDGIYQLIGSTGIIGTTCKPDYQGKMILVARVGANAGYINYFDGKCGITDNTLIVRPNIQSIDYCKYIYYYLNHIELNRYVFGSGQPLITGGMLKRIKVSFGSISEIKKISQFLSLLDQKIAIQNKVIEKYESLIKAINDSVISRLLKGRVVSFKDLYVEAGEGGTPSTSEHSYYQNGSIPFIKIDDLSDKYLTINKDFITELGVQKSSAWVVPENSIIYSNGATIGAISISTYPVCTKQGILGIVPTSDVRTEYLYYFMSSSYFNKQVQRIVTEGTMKTAYLKDINLIKCPLPTIDDQDKIAYGLSSISSKLELEKQLRNKLLSTKKYLLQVLFI